MARVFFLKCPDLFCELELASVRGIGLLTKSKKQTAQTMTISMHRRQFCGLAATGLMMTAAGCAGPVDHTVARDDSAEIRKLSAALLAMNAGVDPQEADHAAALAFSETQRLAIAYQITDPPLRHNIKVNKGLKPRGLCWHWAEDLQTVYDAQGYQTLFTRRAIANAFNAILIDHSTVILAGPGDDMTKGVVTDPWRFGGTLFWAPFEKDTRYPWEAREEVFARKIEILRRKGELPPASDPSTEALPGF